MYCPSYITLESLLRTSHAALGNWPSWDEVEQLRQLASHLDAIWEAKGPIRVSSGFRAAPVNKAVGGVASSAHLFGCAADFAPLADGTTLEDVARWIVHESDLEFDQLIHEGSWLHYGLARPGYGPARRQVLLKRGGKYERWSI